MSLGGGTMEFGEKRGGLTDGAYSRLQPVLEAIAAGGDRVQIIALDGRAASGKTTLARQLEQITGAGVIHMDDFFLPPELRTPERLAEPGGNVDYDRFRREALPLLTGAEAFSYRRFDCGRMALGEHIRVPQGKLRIVEGAYSCHPVFGAYMTFRVFCDIDAELQRERIERRSGKERLSRFLQEWIPMEEAYFAQFRIKERADLIV